MADHSILNFTFYTLNYLQYFPRNHLIRILHCQRQDMLGQTKDYLVIYQQKNKKF